MEETKEIRFRKHKGWDGKIYWVQMTQAEIEERRKLGLVIAVPLSSIVFAITCCFAAGIF